MILRSSVQIFTLTALLTTVPTSAAAAPDHWTTRGPFGGLVGSLAIDPIAPANVYAAGGWNGVFRSTDGGVTWERTMGDLPGDGLFLVYQIALVESAPETLFAATNNGLYKTLDAGDNWGRLGEGIVVSPRSVAVAQSQPAIVYAARYDEGVLKSPDGGETWWPTGDGLPDTEVGALVVDPQEPGLVFALVSGAGVFKTTDGGSSWQDVSAGLPAVAYSDLILDPAQSGLLYLAAYDSAHGIFRSDDGGQSWVPLAKPASYVTSLAIDPSQQDRLYAGTFYGLYQSTDGGLNWLRLDRPSNGFFNRHVQAVAVDPVDPARVFAGMWRAGVFRTVDGGVSWSLSNEGLSALRASSVAVDVGDPNILYAGTDFGVWKSVDGGEVWEPRLNGPENLGDFKINAVVIDPTTPTTVYAGASSGVWKSINGGERWVHAVHLNQVESLAMDPLVPTTLYAGTVESIYKSLDGGGSWFDAGEGIPSYPFVDDIEIDPEIPSTLYAIDGGELFKSINGAGDWFLLENLDYEHTSDLAIDPHSSSTLYAEGYSSQLATSVDGGESWTLQHTGIGHISVLSVDPVTPGTIYAAFNSGTWGVFRTRDSGATWEPLNEGLSNTRVRDLTMDPRHARRLWAATDGSVYKMLADGLFVDGFESGDASAWSVTVP